MLPTQVTKLTCSHPKIVQNAKQLKKTQNRKLWTFFNEPQFFNTLFTKLNWIGKKANFSKGTLLLSDDVLQLGLL